MKKRIAFLLIVPLLCVLAASLNISYMPTGGLLFVSSTPDDELTVPKSPFTTAKPPSYMRNTTVWHTPSPRFRNLWTGIGCRSPLRSTAVCTPLPTTHKRTASERDFCAPLRLFYFIP